MVRRASPGQRGVAYVALLALVALTGGALAGAATVWSQAQQRERERELLWAGEQFRRALRSYASSGDGKLPRQLEDLLQDSRTPAKLRHLRRIYVDPMTGQADWVLLRDARGGIAGLHSRSLRVPLKTGGFVGAQGDFADASSYADWRFIAAGSAFVRRPKPASTGAAPAAASPGAPDGFASSPR